MHWPRIHLRLIAAVVEAVQVRTRPCQVQEPSGFLGPQGTPRVTMLLSDTSYSCPEVHVHHQKNPSYSLSLHSSPSGLRTSWIRNSTSHHWSRNIVTSLNSFQLRHHTPHHNGWTHFISASNSTSPYYMHALFQSAVPLLVPFSCCPASCATACTTWAHRLRSNMCSPMARLLRALLHAASADTFQTLKLNP